MLATRRLQLAAVRYVNQGVWTANVKTLPMLQPTALKWMQRPSMVAAYSKDVKSADSNNPPCDTAPSPPSSSSSVSNTALDDEKTFNKNTKSNQCSTATLGENGVKLPSKDQVEHFAFKTLVYFWDFVYYIFCLCRKLVETYVVNNSTVQHNWKKLLKRMDDVRKEIK